MSQRGKRERLGKQILTVFLTLAMIVSLTPSLGALTGGALGAQEAYAADGISGSVNASTLTFGGEYTLTDDTTIYIDASNSIRSINVEGYTLTIEGNEEDILSVGSIKGYQGNVVLNSGSLDLDTATGEENWAAAVGLTLGGFTMNGGGLFLNCTGNGRYSSYGINAQSFTMNGGTANVRCVTDTTGSAVGIAVNDFNMTGGDLSVDAVTTIENESAYGIEANGATSDSNFHMSGGTLETTGTADTEGYGINWTGDRDKNNFVVDGGKLTAVGVKNGINSWVPVSISGGADVTARSTKSAALYASQAMISINGVGTKVSANSAKGDAIAAYKSTIELGSGVGIIQPENGYVATYGGDSQAIKDASDNWAKEVVIQEVCPAGGGHDWQIVNHKASFTADGYQSMECSKCGKQHDGGIAIGALKVNTVKLEKTSYVYTGNTIKPAVTLASADGP
ncbi:MAG: hypothetical protein II482_04035, partial [Lachnospiraceae bacterium]|nr:hypothetical protein [Lachnospiraceae bacterium]